jgi:hypothetical protein
MKIRVLCVVVALTSAVIAGEAGSNSTSAPKIVVKTQGFVPFADGPINYRSQQLNDPVARLEKRLELQEVKLQFDSKFGYLKSVLQALDVPVSSQVVVFSKTSFQFPDITPTNPRALYYNDDVYVGRVPNAKFLEFVSFDPTQGAIFYILDEHESEQPRFERSEVDCVQCHVAPSTRNVPGVLMRSVLTRPTGYPVAGTPSFVTGHESPLNQRWGGWYVTENGGAIPHMGNVTTSDGTRPAMPVSLARLDSRLDTGRYLTGWSDVVSLLVLAHQTQMHNLITLTNYQTRLALQNAEQVKTISPEVRSRFEGPAEQLVRYLLFTHEAPLTAPVAGTSGFAKEFAARGLRDSKGRSLRDFDLARRIFKYPCSYLIYSDDFDALPAPAKQYVYRRLFEVLSGVDQSAEFASLSSDDRRAILEILVATKPSLPEEWRQFVRRPVGETATASTSAR